MDTRFCATSVFPRRDGPAGHADEIAAKARMADAVASFRSRLIFTIGLTIGLGLLLAGFTVNRMLRLEAARTRTEAAFGAAGGSAGARAAGDRARTA